MHLAAKMPETARFAEKHAREKKTTPSASIARSVCNFIEPLDGMSENDSSVPVNFSICETNSIAGASKSFPEQIRVFPEITNLPFPGVTDTGLGTISKFCPKDSAPDNNSIAKISFLNITCAVLVVFQKVCPE